MASLTVVVLTKNEAPRIARCLESFRPVADELLVVDSGSTDETVAIAREFTDRILVRDWPGRAEQSNYAAGQVRTEWFFHVDADEASTPELNDELRRTVAEPEPGVVGYTVDRHEVFLGRPIRCGLHRSILRLCRTGAAQMPWQRAHARWSAEGAVAALRAPLMHYVDQPLDELLTKLTHRGLLSALDYYEAGRRSSYPKILWHPTATFLRLMVLKGGLLDGLPGLILSGMRSMYCFTRMVRLYELGQTAGGRR